MDPAAAFSGFLSSAKAAKGDEAPKTSPTTTPATMAFIVLLLTTLQPCNLKVSLT